MAYYKDIQFLSGIRHNWNGMPEPVGFSTPWFRRSICLVECILRPCLNVHGHLKRKRASLPLKLYGCLPW